VSGGAQPQGLVADLHRIAGLLRAYEKCRDSSSEAAPAQAEPEVSPGAGDSPLDMLCALFGLTAFERDVLLLCAAMELDSDCAALVARLQDGSPPSFSLALAALPDAHWSALLPTGPLRYWRLIEVAAGPSLVGGGLRIDERILHFLIGLQHLDERLSAIVDLAAAPEELAASHAALAGRIASLWTAADEKEGGLPMVQLCGVDLAAQRDIAASACALAGNSLLVLHSLDLPEDEEAIERLQRLWDREAVLVSASVMLVCDQPQGEDKGLDRRIEGVVERAASPLILSTTGRRPAGERTMITFEVSKPSPAEQLETWQALLREESAAAGTDLRKLIFQFDLKLSAIRGASADALGAVAAEGDEPTAARLERALWDSCRRQARPRLDEAVQRIEPAGRWDDLVLPERERKMLEAIVEQVRHRATVYGDWGFAAKGERGLGIAALFAGASGTGKTLAAEVLATELELDLYRIDLSAVVNKYIGETEKNLRRVFDAAEAGGAILLFDEADALFGRRSDVKDSHDRYANIEVSYLLQRVETYRGLAILTTNLKESIDSAFLRRLRFIVQFPFPDAALRTRIWQRMFPPETPLDALDFTRLAQLNIVGGNIRNIALNAAFLAAAAGKGVSMDHVRDAARAEYAKLEKTLSATETRGWE
jgi:AAA+ superfamily predicted ATPase